MPVQNSFTRDYTRLSAVVEMFPQTSMDWFGYGSAESIELYDLILESGELGQSSYDNTPDPTTGFVKPHIIFVKGKYLALMPTAVEEDTTLTEWPTDGGLGYADEGTWKEMRTNTPAKKKRIVQLNSSPTKKFNRKSSFQHGKNCSFAVHIDINTPSAKGSEADGTRFAAFSWGNDSWAMFFFANREPILAERVQGNWIPRATLPGFQSGPSAVKGETVYLVELIRQSIVVTANFSPDSALPVPDETSLQLELYNREADQGFYSRDDFSTLPPIQWNSGNFRIYGYGLQVAFGFSGVTYPDSGQWTSSAARLRQGRLDTPLLVPWHNLNNGNITYVSLGIDSDLLYRYRATLTPYKHAIGSRTWYRTPDLEAMEVWYPALTIQGISSLGDNGAELEGKILEINVQKPKETDQASLDLTLGFLDNFNAVTGQWRWRPIRVWLGWEFSQPADVRLVNVFTGFILGVNVEEVSPDEFHVKMDVQAASIRAKKMRFGITTAPRGGRTLNTILTFWMLSLGITAFEWHPAGDIIVLPRGRPEDPAFRPDANGDTWGWHEELCRLHGLQLTVGDDGIIRTFPIGAFVINPVTWNANPSNVYEAIFKSTVREDIMSNFTRYMVTCRIPRIKDGLGRTDRETFDTTYSAWAINYAAEQLPTYLAFRSFIERKESNLDFGPTSIGFVNMALYNTADEYILPRQYFEFEGEFAPYIGRRHTIRIIGGKMQEAGIYIVESIEHQTSGENFQGITRLTGYRTL